MGDRVTPNCTFEIAAINKKFKQLFNKMFTATTKCAYRVLVGKPEGRRPLGRPRRRCENNVKMEFREMGRGTWTGLIWLRIWTGGGLL
jgi:hypothetical protein